MRKTMNLALAGALAASAFASTAAAQQAAAGCDNPDDLPVIDLSARDGSWEQEYDFIGTPLTGLYSGPDFIVDTFGAEQDVVFTLTWGDGVSDYDIIIDDVAAEATIAEGASSEIGIEVAEGSVADCLHIEFGMYNFIGSPAQTVTMSAAAA